jgi:hypothetical protein
MINKPPLQRKESRFLSHSPVKAAEEVPKSVTFLNLIKKILTTLDVANKKEMSLPTTINQTTQMMTTTQVTSTKTKSKLFLIS